MGGGDILPALEAGTIDAAEWCCPKPDLTFGFQKVLKHYYLQGLHQVVVNADFYITGKTYKDIGIASVAMGGGDILPALQAGTIDAAEWCCPKPDLVFGFYKVLKHYYLQGLHQVVVNADFYMTGKTYNSFCLLYTSPSPRD